MNPENATYVERPPQATLSPTRPLYWSIRRELWENRSIYLAPLIVMAVVLFGTFMSTLIAAARGPEGTAIVKPISMAPAPIMLATFIVGFFYAVEALYGERRERSILFFKSLPVSDMTTVLSKAAIPIAVLPAIALILSAATQLILLPVAFLGSLSRGASASQLGSLLPEPVIMVYGMTIHTLWFAPIFCWLLLISAWARRAPILWALLPVMLVAGLERMIFNTWYFMNMLQYRLGGAIREGFATKPGTNITRFTELTPLNFLSSPGLWVGLLFAAACLVASVRLRRRREPI